MTSKEDLLELLKTLDSEVLADLLAQKVEKKEDEGPRRSKIHGSTVVLDNSGFEEFKGKADKLIPIQERVKLYDDKERESPAPRETARQSKQKCDRCGESDMVFASQIVARNEDGKTVYRCPDCSLKTKT